MSNSTKNEVQRIRVKEDLFGQRLDNFLRKRLKGVPKSLIYKIIRDGQVRVNSKRVSPMYKVQIDDLIRVPPVTSYHKSIKIAKDINFDIRRIILFENDDFIIINKPSGLSVQPGTKIKNDLISILKSYDEYSDTYLIHRLDKGTSGGLVIGKSYKVASDLGKLFSANKITKFYLALLSGVAKDNEMIINTPLKKMPLNAPKKIQVDFTGKPSMTKVNMIKQYDDSFLAKIKINTGRMHQIRVHALDIGNPICGDTEYGSRVINEKYRKIGLNRIFLHSCEMSFNYNGRHTFKIDLPNELDDVVNTIENTL